MARPKADSDTIRSELLAAAEVMIRETHGRRLVLSEIAARIGISQSYVHRFFPTKADLIQVLAQRWFEKVETALSGIQAEGQPAQDQLETWILTLLRIKRAQFDADPDLFRAYLDIAAEHTDLVATHTKRLTEALTSIIAGMVPPDRLTESLSLVEDATVMFRTPHNIAQFRDRVTDARAQQVVRAVIAALALKNEPSVPPAPLIRPAE